MPTPRFILVAILSLLGLANCVSVQLGTTKISHSPNVQYVAPENGFEKIEVNHVDAAWKNSKNGNIITLLSDCDSADDASLNSILVDATRGISNVTIEDSRSFMFLGRDALRASISGKVDGIESRTDILVLKKNSCTYLLSYVSLPATHAENLSDFNSFVKSFGVP